MESISRAIETVSHYLSYAHIILWTMFLGILEWFWPRSWYAKDVSQDTVLITGAGSGLGRAIALEYARLNSSLILWDIDEKGLQGTKALVDEEYSNHDDKKVENKKKENNELKICLTYVVDVSDRGTIQKIAKQVFTDLNEGREGKAERFVSVLINNAGIYYGLMFHQLADEQIEKIFKVNILAHFWTVRAFLPKMIEHERGHIVEIASMGGTTGMLRQVDYSATKFANVGFEESLSIELDFLGLSDRIHTTVICPFFFHSNLFTGFDSSAVPIMTTDYVAKETVLTMRCNHSKALLPWLTAYTLIALKAFMPRKTILQFLRALGFIDCVKNIKGRASLI